MKHKEVEDRCCGYIVETFRFHKSGQLFNHLNVYRPIKESAVWC